MGNLGDPRTSIFYVFVGNYLIKSELVTVYFGMEIIKLYQSFRNVSKVP